MLGRLMGTVLLIAISATCGPVHGQDASRYPLMTIERHRISVVKAIVDKWADTFAALPPSERRSAEQLGNELWLLRSDRLLAASLAGTFITVAQVLAESRDEVSASGGKASAKVLGDSADDLTFTPVTPCRIVDTRLAGGALAASTTRTFFGFASSQPQSFASQGGAPSNCGLPSEVAALALNVAAVQPQAAGFITLWQGGVTRPASGSTVNYAAADFATATGTIVPVNSITSNQFNAWSPAGVDLVIDVVGYFRAPAATPLDCVYPVATGAGTIDVGRGMSVLPAACPAGYSTLAMSCSSAANLVSIVLTENSTEDGCTWVNNFNTAVSGLLFTARTTCCRSPGR